MARKIQIVIMDAKDYILEYKDFKPPNYNDMLDYIREQVKNPNATKIHIRKWDY